jgi:hypothetical protein
MLSDTASAIAAAQNARKNQQGQLDHASGELDKVAELFKIFEEDAEADEETGDKKTGNKKMPNLDDMIEALSVDTMKEILGIGKNIRVLRREFRDFFYGHDDRILALQAAYEKHIGLREPSSTSAPPVAAAPLSPVAPSSPVAPASPAHVVPQSLALVVSAPPSPLASAPPMAPAPPVAPASSVAPRLASSPNTWQQR